MFLIWESSSCSNLDYKGDRKITIVMKNFKILGKNNNFLLFVNMQEIKSPIMSEKRQLWWKGS
jgi:hypothetical protein